MPNVFFQLSSLKCILLLLCRFEKIIQLFLVSCHLVRVFIARIISNNPNSIHAQDHTKKSNIHTIIQKFISQTSISIQIELSNYIITNNKIIGLAKTRPAYINETMKIFNKLLIPLNECHQNNIVHGDIKPENILISREQEPILIDFGQSVDMSIPDSKYVTMGTAGFMPPELNKNIYGPFTDIYSLGITLYISLLCKKPFILECGNIDFDFNDNQEDLPYKITNMIVDMTDPYYENRPTVGMLLEDYSLDEYDLK